jgi:hypothetical protein
MAETGKGSGIPEGGFNTQKQLEAWLDGQPREVAIAIAWRTAARVFPLLVGEKPDAVILPVLRAIAVSRFAAVWPNHETEQVQSAAFSAAASAALTAAASAAFSAALSAADSAFSAAHSAAFSADSAASAAYSAAYSAFVWAQVTNDARLSEAKGVDALNQAPLWFSLGPEVSESHPPDWVVEEWVALKNQLRSQPRKDFWNVWLGWCDDILHGMSELNRDIEFARLFGHPDAGVEITKDDWKAGPSVVNPKIRQVLDKLPPNRSRRERLGIDEVETPPQPEIKTSSEEVVVRPTTESDFRPDTPDCDVDALGRSLAAFQLAGRLNQVWDAFNSAPDQTTTSEQRREHDSSTWTGLKPVNWDERLKTGFVVHVDAPWGGGKTSFANYLSTILNPYRTPGKLPEWFDALEMHDERIWPERFRRPWMIVHFNAWQHQQVDPPWWSFSEAIRQQCLKAVRCEDNQQRQAIGDPIATYGYRDQIGRFIDGMHLSFAELAWRLTNPAMVKFAAVTCLTLVVLFVLNSAGLIDVSKLKLETGPDSSQFFTTVLAVLVGGGTIFWKLLAGLADSLVPGTPSAAANYSLGSGDPMAKFRKHFEKTIASFNRPIIVFVDDLDRCEPTFVVKLMTGMQTILVSPRIVFVLLGDRDWIEKSFAEVNSKMVGIDVGPEHEFGSRFVEKAIQLSFTLPEVLVDDKDRYVRHLLNAGDQGDLDAELDDSEATALAERFESEVLSKESFGERESANTAFLEAVASQDISEETKQTVREALNRKLSLRAATDESATEATGHMLLGIAHLLPGNPRQIKRIINAVTLLQELARSRDDTFRLGEVQWQLLVRWIVLMIEWPKTWYTLSRKPQLLGRVLATAVDTDDDAEQSLVTRIRANKSVMDLLELPEPREHWEAVPIDAKALEWLVPLMPPTSGSMLDTGKSK